MFNVISTLEGYLMLDPSLLKNCSDIIKTLSMCIKGVYTFPIISQKFNVIARLEFELAYFEMQSSAFSHYATGSPYTSYSAYR